MLRAGGWDGVLGVVSQVQHNPGTSELSEPVITAETSTGLGVDNIPLVLLMGRLC